MTAQHENKPINEMYYAENSLIKRYLVKNVCHVLFYFSFFFECSKLVIIFILSGNYVLNYLATRPKLVHYVTQGLVVLFGRITKLGWFDSLTKEDWAFRNVIGDVSQFLQVSNY